MLKTGMALFAVFLLAFTSPFDPGAGTLKMGLLKYNGGGDWYANPTALPNLAAFCNAQLGTDFDTEYEEVEVGSVELYNFAFVHMTGHGNVVFSDAEAENLRNYLLGGGFLHIDDNYGMDPYVRVAMKKVFPEQEFVELPFEHEVFRQKFEFENGLPKVHKHDDKPAQAFGLFHEGRMVCLYSFESDLGDGWEDEDVHNDPEPIRRRALQMGANIIQFAFQQ
ncbi:MAG: DUF4159 domain-containing protein [Phaeodactylibacter sp.]|jgi:hypothetical protein|nr:DUF4159 domain-containing protein [Phaeodactylibacter sp.]MCI4647086.1 DUF4159 domain-containing protein [Phaeodactylibacter sp.]MCI5091661.1 DUF4159 domain-containing protein [Phaeodactylibacter sp.]